MYIVITYYNIIFYYRIDRENKRLLFIFSLSCVHVHSFGVHKPSNVNLLSSLPRVKKKIINMTRFFRTTMTTDESAEAAHTFDALNIRYFVFYCSSVLVLPSYTLVVYIANILIRIYNIISYNMYICIYR